VTVFPGLFVTAGKSTRPRVTVGVALALSQRCLVLPLTNPARPVPRTRTHLFRALLEPPALATQATVVTPAQERTCTSCAAGKYKSATGNGDCKTNAGSATLRVAACRSYGCCRPEILYSGAGTVCNDDWGDADTRVACRQMGCGGSTTHLYQIWWWEQAYMDRLC
jgi:hypothetical protein